MSLVAPTGTHTVTRDVAPHLTAAHLSSLLTHAVESLTIGQLHELVDAAHRLPGGDDPAQTLGALFI